MKFVSYELMGALTLGDRKTLPQMWQDGHQVAHEWLTSPQGIRQSHDRKMLDDSQRDAFKYLPQISAKRWSSLCTAAGWTVYGAVALSWCKDAKLEEVWAGWLASGFPLKPLPEFERPARFLNPALLPQTRKVSEINQWVLAQNPASAEAYQLAFCACLVALKEPPEFDLSPAQYERAMPQIAAFLKSRLLQKPNRTAEDNAIIELWSETIKNTEWDIWTEAE